MSTQTIVIGGGLAGVSAAHTVLEHGGRVLLLDKSTYCGGNSTKATSGINGALTKAQMKKGSHDSAQTFLHDIVKGGLDLKGNEKVENAKPTKIMEVLAEESAPSIEWLTTRFGLDLSIIGRMGGHSESRTHRGKERFPGMTITYTQIEALEDICEKQPHLARMINKARVTKLLKEGNDIVGVLYEKDGKTHTEYGQVIIATGGYGADFTDNSLLMKHRPDLAHLPTTNGEHCTGDGIKLAVEAGAESCDMDIVQVHPTGIVTPKDPNAKVKWLAAEALRGCGGIILDADGKRFCDELGRRDYVSGKMFAGKGPFRLVLNGAASREIEWHCKHYVGRGHMKKFTHGSQLAKEIGCSEETLKQTLAEYNEAARTKNDKYGKKYFFNTPFNFDDNVMHVAMITPVVHYTLGGVKIDEAGRVCGPNGPLGNLYATGEVCGGVHGKNRLGGNSLLDCVVFGRVSGRTAARDQLRALSVMVDKASKGPQTFSKVGSRLATLSSQLVSSKTSATKQFTLDEVAKHNTDKDCWVVLFDNVYDVTKFLDEHPGGKEAIMLYAGTDCTEQFDMLHSPSVLKKFGPQYMVGSLKK